MSMPKALSNAFDKNKKKKDKTTSKNGNQEFPVAKNMKKGGRKGG